MNAEAYMKQVEKMDRLIANKLIEKEQWRTIATSTTVSTQGDRVQSSGSHDKLADAVIKIIEIEAEIDACIDQFIDIKRDVIGTIEHLPAVEYDILHKVYIQYMTLHEVADAYEMSYSWAVDNHRLAMMDLQEFLKKRWQTVKGETNGTDCN